MKAIKLIKFVLMAITISSVISSCSKNEDEVNIAQPGKPVLLAPENKAMGVDPYSILLEWEMPEGVDEEVITFEVLIGGGDGSIFEVMAYNLENTSYNLVLTRGFEHTYIWKVVATDGKGLELESEAYSFTTRLSTSEEHVTGLWLGTYGHENGSDGNPYGFLFREDGTVRVYNSETALTTAADTLDISDYYKAEGTYSLNGNVVSGTYHWDEEYSNSFECTVNTDQEFMIGTWGFSENVSDGGHFYVEKAEEAGGLEDSKE